MTGGSSVAIVGAGPAGLSAAWHLLDAGHSVAIYERRKNPGGRLRTESFEGARVDVAVQFLASHYHQTLELARQCGAGDLLVRAPGRDALWRGGRIRPLTYGSVAGMAASSALPTGLKLRLVSRYLPFLARNAEHLDPNRPVLAAAAGLDEESIAEWGRREVSSDFVELLVYPLVSAYYGSEPEEASAGLYHALSRAGMDVSLYAVRGGMARLSEALAEEIRNRGGTLRSGAEVEGVNLVEDGVQVRTSGNVERHAAAIVATPPPAAAALVEWPGPLRDWLARVRIRPTATLALLLDRPVPGDWFGLAIPRGTPGGAEVAVVCSPATKEAGLIPEGRGLLLAYPAPSVAEEIAALAPRDALERLLPSIEAVIPGLKAQIERARLYRIPDGYSLFPPGYLTHLRGFDTGQLPSRIGLAGDYLVAPTVEGAVASGRTAADRVSRILEGGTLG